MDGALRVRKAYRHLWLKIRNTEQRELSNCRLLQKSKTCRNSNLSPSGFILGLQTKCYLLNLIANSCQHIESLQ